MNQNIQLRLKYIDGLRALACFLVVLTHSALPSVTGTDGIWKFLISFMCSPATQIFFAISGALLIKPNIQTKPFLKKRLLRLLPPVIFWSVITMVVYAWLDKNGWEESLWRIVLFPFQPVIGIYWFIYVIIGLYFLTPILSGFVVKANRRTIEFYLFLWGITLLLPYLNLLDIPYWAIYNSKGSYYHPLIYFGGYAGFFLLGYYLKNYPIVIGMNKRFVVVILGTVLCMGVTLGIKLADIDAKMDDYLNIGQLFYTTILFTVFQNLPKRFLQYKIWNTIAVYSFGIYLMHPIIVRELVWKFAEHYRMHALLETPLIAIVSLFICWGILTLISRFPKTKWITGI